MVSAVFHYGRGGGFTMFLYPFTKSPGGLPNIGGLASICLAFSVVDYILLLVNGDLVFGILQHRLESVDSFETYLYSSVPDYFFERLTQTWKICVTDQKLLIFEPFGYCNIFQYSSIYFNIYNICSI